MKCALLQFYMYPIKKDTCAKCSTQSIRLNRIGVISIGHPDKSVTYIINREHCKGALFQYGNK